MEKTIRVSTHIVATQLRHLHAEFRRPSRADVHNEDEDSYLSDDTLDVRLRITPDGVAFVQFGAPDYDIDHSGAVGASVLTLSEKLTYADAVWLARSLINEAADMAADIPDFPPVAYALTRAEKRGV